MSAESKKKHGEAGASNARTQPFRLNGLPPDWQVKRRGIYQTGASPSAGSRFLLAVIGGLCAGGAFPDGQWERRMEHAQSRVTSPVFKV